MLFKKVEMKNRVSLEGYGEILAGRIARPYEKGTPRAKQGDEYWVFFFFFYKAFCIDFQRERVREKDGDGEWKKERVRVKERRDGIRGERQRKPSLLFTLKSKGRREAGWILHDGFSVLRWHIEVRWCLIRLLGPSSPSTVTKSEIVILNSLNGMCELTLYCRCFPPCLALEFDDASTRSEPHVRLLVNRRVCYYHMCSLVFDQTVSPF